MKVSSFVSLAPAAALVAAGLAATPASADAVAEFYKGKHVPIIVAARAGGGHSNWSLFIGKYLQKHMPGNPNFINQNMGGAGGTKAANYLYNRAPRDGTAIGILLSDTPFAARMRSTGIKYDPKDFNYIGGAEQPQGAFVVYKEAGVKTLEDVKKKEVIVGSTGKGSQTYILPKLANGILGTKFKIVTGYRGMSGIYKAMDSKEVMGFQSGWSSVSLIRPQYLENNLIEVLAVNSLKPLPEYPDKPLFVDLVSDPLDKKIVAMIANNDIIGRAWLTPPGVPKARLDALRAAFKKMFSDPEALAAAKKRKMNFEYIDWKPQEAHAKAISAADDKLFERVRTLIGLK